MLLGEVPLVSGVRSVGRATVIGLIGQQRSAYDGDAPLVQELVARTGSPVAEARSLLAKFGLGADHIARPCSSLSPGERTRAHLAELQARGVNVLILDEPTNHLDLEAVEQLEHALPEFDGPLVVVSHDRRFLERIAPTRVLTLPRRAEPASSRRRDALA
jgi:ATPase subunit of ABC transporter with duplicated ATPase domains